MQRTGTPKVCREGYKNASFGRITGARPQPGAFSPSKSFIPQSTTELMVNIKQLYSINKN